MGIITRLEILHAILRFKDSPNMGIIYCVLSTISFSSSDFAAQKATHSIKDFPLFEVAFVRSGVQLLLLVPFILIFRSRVLFGREKWMHLFSLSLVAYCVYISVYTALKFIPASIVLPITATCPLFATVFSYFLLKEKCLLSDVLCGIIGLLGVFLIARPMFIFGIYGKKNDVFKQHISESKYLIGCSFALLVGIGKAYMITSVRKWARDSTETRSDQSSTVLYPSILGCILTPPLMLFSGQQLVLSKSVYGTLSLFAVGVLTLIGLLCNASAVKTQTAPVVGLLRNLDIIWAFLLQYLFMNIWPSMLDVAGSIIIVMTTITVCFRANIIEKCRRCYRDYEQCNMEEANENIINDKQ